MSVCGSNTHVCVMPARRDGACPSAPSFPPPPQPIHTHPCKPLYPCVGSYACPYDTFRMPQQDSPTHPDLGITARALVQSLRAVLKEVPGAPHSPTALAQRLGLSRVTVSKLLSALEQRTPFDVLERIPGPDSLRDAVSAAAALGVHDSLARPAHRAIDSFDGLIRGHFGTRAALHAAIGHQSDSLRTRVANAARAEVFKGMRQVLGVEAETWLTSMFFVPSKEDAGAIAVTTIHGALGMRRLSPQAQVYFTFGPPYHEPGGQPDPTQSPISLKEFYTNRPATLETSLIGGLLRHRLINDQLGKRALVDMLAVSHNAKGSRRFAAPPAMLRGVSLFVDIPARTLICDAVVHRDLFPGAHPRLIAYNPGPRGPANPNDPDRDIDRMTLAEQVVEVTSLEDWFALPEVPNYEAMVNRVSSQIGHAPAEFNVFRLRMPYPITGFQLVVAFDAPLPPPEPNQP